MTERLGHKRDCLYKDKIKSCWIRSTTTRNPVCIICQEQDPGSEMQSGIRTLAAEELGLDIQNIFVEYMDAESFTSEEDV